MKHPLNVDTYVSIIVTLTFLTIFSDKFLEFDLDTSGDIGMCFVLSCNMCIFAYVRILTRTKFQTKIGGRKYF